MAVKAMCAIREFVPSGDASVYKVKLDIWAPGSNVAVGIENDVEFGMTTASTTVNAAIKAFVEAYILAEWEIEVGMLDSVKLCNPVSLL